MFYYYDPTYVLILIGAIVALYAQIKVSTTYAKWQKVPSATRMTGAQMAPTTLLGQKASTAPTGRMEDTSGYPVLMAEIMASLPGVAYSERVTVNTPARIAACKKALKKAFELQLAGKGMGFVEVLSPCPTGWSMSPVQALDWIDEKMMKVYPLGVLKDVE